MSGETLSNTFLKTRVGSLLSRLRLLDELNEDFPAVLNLHEHEEHRRVISAGSRGFINHPVNASIRQVVRISRLVHLRGKLDRLSRSINVRGPDLHLLNRAFFDLKAKIVLMHVRPRLPKIVVAALGSQTLEQHEKAEVDKAMGWTRDRFNQSRVPFDEVIEIGDPAEKIVEHAKKENFDLIVMGSHVDEPTRRLVRGSVTFQVLSSCKVPVLVIR